MPIAWDKSLDAKRSILIPVMTLCLCWSSGVLGDDIYHEIHKLFPSLRMPNVIISQPSAAEEEELNRNKTMEMLPSMQTEKSSSSGKKTVVFPSPICVSLPMAPCVILQIFWRNSSSSMFGASVPVSRVPTFPKPRERQLSHSQLYKLHSG